jgi:hypothetical protein
MSVYHENAWENEMALFALAFIGKIKMATKMVPIVMPFNAAKSNNATKQGSLTERER